MRRRRTGGEGGYVVRQRLRRPRGEPKERSKTISLGDIVYEASHAALREYRRTHHDQFDLSGRWASVSPQFQAAWDAASHAVASALAERPQDPRE